MNHILQVKKLSKNAVLPVRGSALAAGFDLASAEETVVPARGKALVKTDLAIAIPPGCYGRVAPRSGLAWKKHIDVGAGVIDADYRGNVGVVLFNHAAEDFEVKKGDRVAQLILEQIYMAEVQEVEELAETKRGAGGFGSTGVDLKIEASEPLRAVRVVSPGGNGELSELTEALSRISSLSEKGLLKENEKSELKKRAMEMDARLLAALKVYGLSGDEKDFIENLKLLLSSASPQSL